MTDKSIEAVRVEKAIEHFSKEIETITETTMTFRTRIAFVAWIGPFILLSSYVVSTKGVLRIPSLCDEPLFYIALVASGACYLGLAVIGGRMERHAWKRCDVFREKIIQRAKLKRDTKSDEAKGLGFTDERMKVWAPRAYFLTFALILISFLGVSLAISRIEKIAPGGESAAATQIRECRCCSACTPNNPLLGRSAGGHEGARDSIKRSGGDKR